MKTVSLGKISKIQIGYQSRSRIGSDPAGTHRLIQGRDLRSPNHLRLDAVISFTPDHNTENCLVNSGDILFQARGGEHFAYCLTESAINAVASSSFYIIRVDKSRVSPLYLAWWINQPPAQRYFQAESNRSSIPYVSVAALIKLAVKLPAIETQIKIVKVNELWQREQMLRQQIIEQRMRLVIGSSIAAIEQQGA